jgi:hypothetical protein
MRTALLGLVAVTAFGAAACAAAPAQMGVLVAEGPASRASDGAAPMTAAKTTLATALSADVAKGDSSAKAKMAKVDADSAADEAPESIPTACSSEASIGKNGKTRKLCLPAPDYAKKLCGGIYPEVALGLFAKGTPWSRVYLAGDVDAWNASGGLTHRAQLAFDEEVVVLAKHAAGGSGGIVMTGAQSSYDVMRWDGTCVSVMEGELTTSKPPKPKPAPVPWSRLEETTRRALLASPRVKTTRDAVDKACSAISSDKDKARCDKADKAFSQAIVDLVRGGVTLPTPARRP